MSNMMPKCGRCHIFRVRVVCLFICWVLSIAVGFSVKSLPPSARRLALCFAILLFFFSCLPSYDRQQIEWSVPDWSNFNEQANQQTRAIQLQSIRCLQNVRIQSRGFDTNERQLKCMHQHCTPRTQFRWDERKNSNNNKMDMMKYWSTIIQSEMAMREW